LPTKVYDAIVVGTGAGGGTAMKILCEADLKVCAVNSGPRTDPSEDYRLHRQVYDLKYRGYGNPLRLLASWLGRPKAINNLWRKLQDAQKVDEAGLIA
jgi:choline dehydrogenase-like flavoprotein